MMADSENKLHVVLASYRGNMFCGGQGVYLVNLARALRDRGHRVTVISGPPHHDEVERVLNIRLNNHNFINKSARDLPFRDPFSVFKPLNFYEYLSARAGSNPVSFRTGSVSIPTSPPLLIPGVTI